jgi:hypothetical protein
MFIADRVAEMLKLPDDKEIIHLTSGENQKYYKMGSIGPDLFFFAPDYDAILYPSILLPFARDVVQPIRDVYEDIIGPVVKIIDDVEEGVDAVLDEVTCNAASTVNDRVDAINESLAGLRDSFMAYIFSESFNMFDMMRPPMQNGKDEREWYWFDMLHYRRTGDFLQKMWDNSTTDEQKAFVLGYATHIAADVSGHPYVNQAVGGPARAHNQRHHFVENIIDVWFYDQALSPSVNITNARLHQQLPHGGDLDKKGILFAILDGEVEIKGDLQGIFEMVSTTLGETFPDAERPRRLQDGITSPEDINLAYWLSLASLKVSTDSFIPRPEEPLESTLDDIVKAAEEFLDNVSNPPQSSSTRPELCFALWEDDCDFSLEALEEWLYYLWDNIVYLGELIAWAASVLKDLLDILVCTVTAPLKAAVSALLWIIQSALYAILEEIREALVLAAIIHPQPEWVRNNPIAQEITELSNRSWDDVDKRMYPHRAQPSNAPFLGYPKTPVENEPTVPGPYPAKSTPAAILTGIGSGNDTELYSRYIDSETPSITRDIEFETIQKETMPAIPLAIDVFRALRQAGNKIPDWNLDADRGYHYKNWKAEWDRLRHDFKPDSTPIDEVWHTEQKK